MSRRMWAVLLVAWLIGQAQVVFLNTLAVPNSGWIIIGICGLGLVALALTRNVRRIWPLSVGIVVSIVVALLGMYLSPQIFPPEIG